MKLTLWTPDPRPRVMEGIAPVMPYLDGIDKVVVPDLADIDWQSPGPVLAMGSKPLEALQARGHLPKGRKITSLRKQVMTLPGYGPWLMVTYGVGIRGIDYEWYVDMLTDVAVAGRFARRGTIEPVLGDYRYVTDFGDDIDWIKAEAERTGKPVKISIDTETTGKDPYRPGAHFVTIQVARAEGMASVVYFKSYAEMMAWWERYGWQLDFLLNDERVRTVLATGKYDFAWFRQMFGLGCRNFCFDTTLVGSLLDENRKNSLNVHAKIYAPDLGGYDDEFDRTVDKSQMQAVAPEKLLPYAGGDPDACLRAHNAMRPRLLEDQALARFYINVLHPAARAFEVIEQGGVFIDMEAYGHLESELKREAQRISTELKRDVLGALLIGKHYDPDLEDVGGINFGKASLVNELLFSPMGCNLKPKMMTEKSGKPSTAREHIEMFKDSANERAAKFANLFSEFNAATKMLSTYVTGFKQHIRSDGRFHPSYFLHKGDKDEGDGGTVTGRLSVRDPAFQTIPAHTRWAHLIRRCFPAPEGMLVCEKDYSQGELRIMACVSGDTNMIQVYRENKDLHAKTGGKTNGLSYEETLALKFTDPKRYKMIRQRGKAGNFGLIYEISAEGFVTYARVNYGVHLSVEEAQDIINIFFADYPSVLEYHRIYKAFAKKHGFVRSPLGRVRHLPLINSANGYERGHSERQSINSPIQSTLSDLMIWAIAIAHQRGYDKEAPCFGVVHDAGYNYIPIDNWEFYVARDKELMEHLPTQKLGWNPQLTFVTDAKIGRSMSKEDLVELEFQDGKVMNREKVEKALVV